MFFFNLISTLTFVITVIPVLGADTGEDGLIDWASCGSGKRSNELICFGVAYHSVNLLASSGNKQSLGCFADKTCDIVFMMQKYKQPDRLKYSLFVGSHPDWDQKEEKYEFSIDSSVPFLPGDEKEFQSSGLMIARIDTKGQDVSAVVMKSLVKMKSGKEEAVTGNGYQFPDQVRLLKDKTNSKSYTRYVFTSTDKLFHSVNKVAIYKADLLNGWNELTLVVGDRVVIQSDRIFLFKNTPRGTSEKYLKDLEGSDTEDEESRDLGNEVSGGRNNVVLIVLIVILLVTAGIGGYFMWRFHQKRRNQGFDLDRAGETGQGAGEAIAMHPSN